MTISEAAAMPGGTSVQTGARLDRLPTSSFHKRIFWLIGAGMFFDGYDLYVGTNVLGSTVSTHFSTLGQNAQFVAGVNMAIDLEAGVASPAATPARGAEAKLAETVRPIARRANGPGVSGKVSHDRPLIQDLYMVAERTDGGEVGIHDDNVAGLPECQRVQGLVSYAAKRSHHMGDQGGVGQ